MDKNDIRITHQIGRVDINRIERNLGVGGFNNKKDLKKFHGLPIVNYTDPKSELDEDDVKLYKDIYDIAGALPQPKGKTPMKMVEEFSSNKRPEHANFVRVPKDNDFILAILNDFYKVGDNVFSTRYYRNESGNASRVFF